jgi:hypothetical protein
MSRVIPPLPQYAFMEWCSVKKAQGQFYFVFTITFYLFYVTQGVKRPEREADHSPPSSAEVENAWSYTSTPQYVFKAWCLIKHRIRLHGMTAQENFTCHLFFVR